jgi:predicted secreted protein
MLPSKIVLLLGLAVATSVQAQTATGPSTSGTMVVVPASGEVKHANDEAVVTFSVEENDKDKVAAASRVNSKMKEGMEIVRRADPGAQLKTLGYYTVPVYPENPPPQPMQKVQRPQVPVAWRVGQMLEVRTRNLAGLEKTAAAAQKVLAISNLTFGLTKETEKRLDDQRIAETYRNLNERIASIASAMGRKPSDAVLDTVDFEASGIHVPAPGQVMMYARGKSADQVPEPSFEPGETTLQMRLVGKVKFK